MTYGTKSITILSCSLLLLLNAAVANAGWKLTFSDEFDGNALDLTKWKLSLGLWANQTLAGNGEKQCYMPEGVRQADGLLLLVAKQSVTPASACRGAASDLPYSSGAITTSGCARYESSDSCRHLKRFTQAYGYFEIRAKLPKGKGFWPGFWLMPNDGSWPPEIDVMEALGHMPFTIYQTYHYTDPVGAHQKAGKAYNGHDFTSSFSNFGIDWQPGLLIWYVDGEESFRLSSPDVTSKSMHLLLNLAVGGYWPGDPDQTTIFPAIMSIDYVRVYQRVNDGIPDDLPPASSPSGPK